MSLKNWYEIPIGGVIVDAGNAKEYETGSWRTYKPIFYKDKCINCLFCWVYCPDAAILVENAKVVGIDYVHCKGCGICEHECPDKADAIEMVLDHQ